MKPRRRAGLAGIVVLAMIAVGVAGYMLIESMSFTDAFYMTIITLFTVGFREVKELSTAGMYFTIFFIVAGVGTLFFLISSFVELMLEEVFGEVMGRRRMSLKIKKIKDHYVICGFGRVGENICKELKDSGKEILVVEKDEKTAEQAISEGFLTVVGDATNLEVLEEAGVGRARGLVAALHTDADNLFVTLTARSMNPELFIVTRSVYPQTTDQLIYAGADRVISPYVLGAKRIANLLLKPSVCDFLDVVFHAESIEFRIEEMVVGKDSPYAGRTIGESRVKTETGALILALREPGQPRFNTNPDKNTRIREGDMLIVMGTAEQLEKIREKL